MTLPLPPYNPQSPRPHSPPHSPSREQASLHALESTVVDLNTPATTPDSGLSPAHNYPTLTSRRVSAVSTHSNSSSNVSVSGMGINFPADKNPLPSELSEGKKEPEALDMIRSLSDTVPTSPASSSMAQSRSTGAAGIELGQTLQAHGATTHRARSNSPSPVKVVSSTNGFASSSSFHPAMGSEHRERIVSPTRPGFHIPENNNNNTTHSSLGLPPNISIPSNGTTMQMPGEGSPLWSPAIDGKKEPSIKPAPFGREAFNPDLYAHPGAKNRSRSPFPNSGGAGNGMMNGQGQGQGKAEYQGHPLSSGGAPAYNQTTTSGARGAEGFYDSAAYWLGLYFFFNLGLTLFNKIVLVSFPFPYTLTGLHALSGCAGCYFALERGAFVPARLTQKETLILAAFSVLYTINIAVSNISLQLVTVPFHQVVRASTPLFTILISTVVLRTRFSMAKLVSLLPVVAGVGFATYGDYYFTAWGLILTLLGTFLAALKTVVTNLIQTGGGQRLKLHPLDLLMRMSPLAFIQCVAYGWYTGELERVRRYGATQMTRGKAIALLINGVIACGLNIVSFTANKKAGALTMTVSANCKQVLTIALAVVLFDLSISPTNGVGILLTLIGGGWYGYVEYQEKQKKSVKLVDRS